MSPFTPFHPDLFDRPSKPTYWFNSNISDKGKPVVRPGRKAMGLPRGDCQAAGAVNRPILGGSAMVLSISLRRVHRQRSRRGSTLLLTALALVPLLGMVAFAVDYGRICVAKAAL